MTDKVNDDEMLIHLNLVHQDQSFHAEYEKPTYRYFADIIHDDEEEKEEAKQPFVIEDTQEETKEQLPEEDKQEDEEEDKTVDYLFVVGFDHKIGSVIEYFYPEPDPNIIDENVKKALSFIGLPDGSHSVESDYSFFIIPDAQGNLYYGVSCFRQIKSSELEVKDEKVSRSFVQKSACVLSRIPIFGTLMIKLLPTTHAYFKQKNFTNTKILEEFYGSINHYGTKQIKYSDFYTGFNLKRLVLYNKQNLITILKLIMLEGKIMVYSQKASKVSTFVLTLFSLLPGAANFNYEENSKIKKVIAHFKAYGLPLKVFNNRCLFLPLSTLNDLDALSE